MQKNIHNTIQTIQRRTQIDLKYLFKGGFWLTLGQGTASISALATATMFANFVDPNTFGTYKYILAAMSLLGIPTLRGISVAYTQAVARGYEGDYHRVLTTKISWGLIGTVMSLILSIYYFFNGNNILGTSFVIVALFIPFFETFSLYGSILNGRKHFKQATKYFIISRTASLPILIGAIYYTDNVALILLAYILPTTLIRYGLSTFIIRKHVPNIQKDPGVFSYGKHLSLVGIFTGSIRYFDTLLLFTMISAPALAIYALATAPADQIVAQYKSLSNLMMPKLSKKSGNEIHATFWKRLSIVILVSTLLAAIYTILVPFLFYILFPLYPESILFAQMLSVVLFFSLINAFLGGIIQARLDITPKNMLYWRMMPRIIFICSLFVLVPLYGILGAVFGRIIFSAAVTITHLLQYYRLLHLHNNSTPINP